MGGGIGMRLTMFLGRFGNMMKGVGSGWCNCLFIGMIARTTRKIERFDGESTKDVERDEELAGVSHVWDELRAIVSCQT
jgi:hypothetical protein